MNVQQDNFSVNAWTNDHDWCDYDNHFIEDKIKSRRLLISKYILKILGKQITFPC